MPFTLEQIIQRMYFRCWDWFYFTVDTPDIFLQVDKSLQPDLKMLGVKGHLSIGFGGTGHLEVNRVNKQHGFMKSKSWSANTEFLFIEIENLWIQVWHSKYVGLSMWAQFRTAQLGPWILIKQSLLSPGVLLPTLIQIDVVSNISQQKELRNGNELIWGSLRWHLNWARPRRKPRPHRWGHAGALGSPWWVCFTSDIQSSLSSAPCHPLPPCYGPTTNTCCSSDMKDALPITIKLTSVPACTLSHTWALLTPKGYKHVLKWFAEWGAYLPAIAMI